MFKFIDPDDFSSDAALLEHVIEHVVLPSLEAEVGPEQMDGIEGTAYVFGGRQGVDPSELGRLQQKVEVEGLDVEYALAEFCDFDLGRRLSTQRKGLRITYFELGPASDDTPIPSGAEIAALYHRVG